MKYLGLDLGTRTLGVSISDATKTVAGAYCTIHFDDDDYDKALTELATIIEKESIEKMILGFPKKYEWNYRASCRNDDRIQKKIRRKISSSGHTSR